MSQILRKGAQRLHCPHCESTATTRATKHISPQYVEVFLICDNPQCAFAWKAAVSPIHALSPSGAPNPQVNIPIGASHQTKSLTRESLDALAEKAIAQEKTLEQAVAMAQDELRLPERSQQLMKDAYFRAATSVTDKTELYFDISQSSTKALFVVNNGVRQAVPATLMLQLLKLAN